MTTPDPSPYLTTEQVAELLHLTPKWVQKKCKTGELRAVKVGRAWRVRRTDLDRFMTPPPAAPRDTGRRRAS